MYPAKVGVFQLGIAIMQGYIGYIRVSTVRQGTKGVSLVEQRDAILRYAERNHFSIAIWLKETETAAKSGRPVFNQALKLLRAGKARGIVLHKLDRGARNLRDWIAIGDLSDQGVEVHFVTETLDLQSRGGRLSADIQAVVSADYIRNLREETRKGFYGRLKQGLYPLRAPLGYVDCGKGNPKTIDPIKGPLVKQTFELYGAGHHSLETLGEEMYRRGLRNRRGRRVTRNGLSTILNNPFYIGIIRIQKTSETFAGVHGPLIGSALFKRVNAILNGKTNTRSQSHDFLFRRMLTCARCNYSLIGERQKGRVYYRCHSPQCSGTSLREDFIEGQVAALLQKLQFNESEKAYFKAEIQTMRETWTSRRDEELQRLTLQRGQVKARLDRLTDAYLDGALDKAMFETRKESLLVEQKAVAESEAQLARDGTSFPDRLEQFLELAGNAWLSYQSALFEEKREMVKIFTSNRKVDGKTLDLEPSIPFREVVKRVENSYCDLQRDTPRTLGAILNGLTILNEQELLPELKLIFGCRADHTKDRGGAKE